MCYRVVYFFCLNCFVHGLEVVRLDAAPNLGAQEAVNAAEQLRVHLVLLLLVVVVVAVVVL